ncbi:MAG: methionine--tRNA ligase [Candidatus Saccharimonadales bacterium]
MSSNSFYITTSIPYVNGDPHIGFAMELIQADVLARQARLEGKDVIYSAGSDEHGTKVAQKAEELGLTPKAFTDQMSEKFRELGELLNVSNDRFVRTTDPGHEQRAQIIWKNLSKDIYKARYIGWYDVRQEEFVPESQLDPERTKPDHPQAYQKLEEENYFFRLSKYRQQIWDAIEKDELKIVPKTRRNEIISLLKEGLEDISISRPKDKLDWGVPVPGDKTQVMYVWFEALMNYLTVLGYPEHDDFKKFWPANVQVVGKDITRFHAAIWPGMLLSLGLPLQKLLYVHSFITVEGAKMSKSVGNVIAPADVVAKYGVDAFRYYFLRHIPSYEDGDYSVERFENAYNNELANELGNTVQRTAVMIQKYQNGIIGDIPEAEHDETPVIEALNECRFDRALDSIWELIRGLNQYIDEAKPWMVAKEKDEQHLKEILAYQVSCLLQIAGLLKPFLPETAEKIEAIFAEGIIRPLDGTLFPKNEE